VADPTTTCTTTGLPTGTLYADVVAYNAFGVSAPSARVTPPVPPAAPTNPQAVASTTVPRTIIVSWQAPATSPVPIANYTATVYTGTGTPTPVNGATCTTAGLTCTISNGLANGTPYRVSITSASANPILVSAPTALVSVATPNLPGTPAIVSAVGGHDAAGVADVKLTWNAAAANGATVTGYKVITYRCTGIPAGTGCLGGYSANAANGTPLPTCTLVPVGTGPFTCTVKAPGLTFGTRYWFFVTATNIVGTTVIPAFNIFNPPPVSAVPVTTGPVVTLAPRNAAKGTLTVAWTKANTPATAKARWTVRVFPSATSNKVLTSCVSTGAAARCTVRGLVSGRTYYVSVTPTGAPWPVVKAALRVKGSAR
jgi:hypothetical protein